LETFDALDKKMTRFDCFLDVLQSNADLIIEMGVDPELDAFKLSPELGKLFHLTSSVGDNFKYLLNLL